MIYGLIAALALLAVAAVLGLLYVRDRHRRRTMPVSGRRILFPFTGHAVSHRALDAALRLAAAEHATLVPVFLARVPMQVPLDAALTRQCTEGMPLLETIEQRAAARGVAVDARLERGRTPRHALREAILHERFDRIVVAAASSRSPGFDADDIAWLLDHAPGEVLIVRPDDDRRTGAGRPVSPAPGAPRAARTCA